METLNKQTSNLVVQGELTEPIQFKSTHKARSRPRQHLRLRKPPSANESAAVYDCIRIYTILTLPPRGGRGKRVTSGNADRSAGMCAEH